MEVKFKAWLKELGEMVEYNEIIAPFIIEPTDSIKGKLQFQKLFRYFSSLTHTSWENEPFENVIFIYYTGLKSSDGGCGLPIKEAYFGDVIRFYNTDGKEHQAEVIWYEQEHCIGFRRLTDGFVYTQRIFNDSGYSQPSKLQFEILGNVYENPELLSAKTEA